MRPDLRTNGCRFPMQLTTHACRRSSKHLHVAVLASARRAYRPVRQIIRLTQSQSRRLEQVSVHPSTHRTAVAQAGRIHSADVQTHRQDSKLLLIKEAINFERAQQYSNAQGKSSDFAGFLVRAYALNTQLILCPTYEIATHICMSLDCTVCLQPRGLQDLCELPQANANPRPLAALQTMQTEAQEYRKWDTGQREMYLRKLLDILKTFEHLKGYDT